MGEELEFEWDEAKAKINLEKHRVSFLTASATYLLKHCSYTYQILNTNEVEHAISNCKAAPDGQRIRWIGDGLLQPAFISVGSSTILVAAGMNVPTAQLAGGGLSLIVSGTIYNVDKREWLRSNPYTYLLSIGRELTRLAGRPGSDYRI